MQNKPEWSQQESDAGRAASETKKLRILIKQLKRTRFGYNLEQTDRDLFQLGLEDLEQCIAAAEANHCSGDRQAVLTGEKPFVPIVSLAEVLIKKYAEHLSLHRQIKMLAKQNIHLEISALGHLVGHICHSISPLYDQILRTIIASPKIFVDCTDVAVLDPRRGRVRPGQIWAYAVDDRPWSGTVAPAVAYVYTEGSNEGPPYLTDFSGILQADRYSYFSRPFNSSRPEHARLALCWARCRQQFSQIYEATNSPIAVHALKHITQLYIIEEQINGRSAEVRKFIRGTQSRPILQSLQIWMREQFEFVPENSPLAKLISCILNRWEAFTLFLEDGRVEIDNNTVERLIRPSALGRKNTCLAGFNGGAQHWTIVASVIQSAKLNSIEPLAYLCDVLERIAVCCRDTNKFNLLLPWEACAACKLPSGEIKSA